jgi:hypothetical protein
MGDRTSNIGLYKPDVGEDGYGDEKNADADDLDKRLQNLPDDGTHDNTAHATDYAATDHTHPASDLEQSNATNGQHLAWDGSAWVPVDPPTDTDTNTQAYSLAASGSTTLSSGAGTVNTGVGTDSDHYDINVNPGTADIAASLDGSGSNYVIHLEENTTSVGNPTVKYQLLRSEL